MGPLNPKYCKNAFNRSCQFCDRATLQHPFLPALHARNVYTVYITTHCRCITAHKSTVDHALLNKIDLQFFFPSRLQNWKTSDDATAAAKRLIVRHHICSKSLQTKRRNVFTQNNSIRSGVLFVVSVNFSLYVCVSGNGLDAALHDVHCLQQSSSL